MSTAPPDGTGITKLQTRGGVSGHIFGPESHVGTRHASIHAPVLHTTCLSWCLGWCGAHCRTQARAVAGWMKQKMKAVASLGLVNSQKVKRVWCQYLVLWLSCTKQFSPHTASLQADLAGHALSDSRSSKGVLLGRSVAASDICTLAGRPVCGPHCWPH